MAKKNQTRYGQGQTPVETVALMTEQNGPAAAAYTGAALGQSIDPMK